MQFPDLKNIKIVTVYPSAIDENWTLCEYLIRRALNTVQKLSVVDVLDNAFIKNDSETRIGVQSLLEQETSKSKYDLIITQDKDTLFVLKDRTIHYKLVSNGKAAIGKEIASKALELLNITPDTKFEAVFANKTIFKSLEEYVKGLNYKEYEYDKINPSIEQAYNLDPENPELAWKYGLSTRLEKQLLKESTEMFEKANEKSPYYGRLYLSLGVNYSELYKFELAGKCDEYACTLMPYNPWPFQNRAVHLSNNMNKHQEALEYFDKAISLDPWFADVYYNRFICYKKLKQYNSASYNAVEYVKHKWYLLWEASQDPTKAERIVEDAEKMGTQDDLDDFVTALINLASWFEEIGEIDSATEYIRKAKQIFPWDEEILDIEKELTDASISQKKSNEPQSKTSLNEDEQSLGDTSLTLEQYVQLTIEISSKPGMQDRILKKYGLTQSKYLQEIAIWNKKLTDPKIAQQFSAKYIEQMQK